MKHTFLIVDDIEDNRISLNAILNDAFESSDIFMADNGQKALSMAKEKDPDVILLDIIMPDMDGFAVCKKLKSDPVMRDIPVVILTALQETRDNRMKGLEAGAEAFLSKPVDMLELTVQIKAMLRIREANLLKRNERENLAKLVTDKTGDLEKTQVALLNLLDDLRSENETRKKTEQELKETEVLLTTVMENLPVGIAVNTVGEDVHFQYMNDNFGKYYRVKKDRLMSEKDFWQVVYEDPAFREEIKRRVLSDCETGNPDLMQWQDIPITRQNEETSWVAARNIPVPGKPLMISTVWDVTEHIKAEQDNIRSLEVLRKTLASIVRAMSTTVEIRDPYTAGHQKRVADLARAIAEEMQMNQEQIEGLFMAAQIHDLGKISVPAELLSMPRKLTDIEFGLIKTHSQSGYDILKDIDFPWPIARIILEHHEKNDGTGYPQGITGNGILIESQILAVADAVEAIASHRPYRAALGVNVALEEIEKQSGVGFSREVVDATLRIFREQKYTLSV